MTTGSSILPCGECMSAIRQKRNPRHKNSPYVKLTTWKTPQMQPGRKIKRNMQNDRKPSLISRISKNRSNVGISSATSHIRRLGRLSQTTQTESYCTTMSYLGWLLEWKPSIRKVLGNIICRDG